MKEQVGTKPEFSPADKSKIVLVSIFLAMLLFIFGILLGLLLRQNGVRLSMLFPGQQVMAAVPSTSAAEASGAPVAVTLLEVSGTPGENTIHIVVAVSNGGETALMLSPNNVLLTQPDGRPLSLLRIEPRLPRKIRPGATKTFDFTFRRPASETATLKVFTVEYQIEGY